MKIGTIQALACVGLGAMLGLVAATRDITPFSRADVAPSAARQVAAETGVADPGVGRPSCCSEGLTKGVLLTQADAGETAAKAEATASGKKPNIVFIMGDDVGWFNIGAYHRGMMAGKTPNLDRLASQGMLFTDYYAEPSCTAGRANFITGQLPIRTGLTTVGQAGAKVGMPASAPTIATALKSMGYATGQFGKNHLGDLNEYLPTVHGFDEFFGYLYHLDAMEDPAFHSYPPELKAKVGPRNMIHSWATDKDDPTEQPRWGKVGKQKIEDAGTLYPDRMKTVDDEILDHTFKFIDKAKAGRQAVLRLAEPDPDARHHPPLRQVRQDADAGERLVHLRGRHGPARRHRRLGDEEAGRPGRRGRHDPRLHDRQRRRELHLARRRPDAVRRRQGDGARRRHARALHRALAGQGAGRQGREPDHVGARLVPDARGGGRRPGRSSTSSSRASSSARRPTRSISTATTRPT